MNKEKEIKGVKKYIINELGQKEYFWSWRIIQELPIKNGESFEVKMTPPYLSIKKLRRNIQEKRHKNMRIYKLFKSKKMNKLLKIIKKTILKWLYETQALEFESWKSPTHLEQYTSIKFFGEEIERIKWSQLDILNKM